ncbi:MAG: TetR family transcriptional regulator [Gammaproteobacteria bacterium]
MKKTNKSNTPKKPVRDRKLVENKLVASACQLLSELGPRAVTIRDIAKKAGVNHGQIHHYFGGKKGLLSVAMHRLAREHTEHVAQRTTDYATVSNSRIPSNPPPLTLSQDKHYQMAVLRCVLDGEMELATIELNNKTSIPRQVLNEVTETLDKKTPITDVKAAIAVAMCIEHAWAALDQYVLLVVDAKPSEIDDIRNAVAEESRAMLERILAKKS